MEFSNLSQPRAASQQHNKKDLLPTEMTDFNSEYWQKGSQKEGRTWRTASRSL